MKRAPRSLKEFVRPPSRRAWQSELDDGWRGPDGSSNSTDTIMGVLIGRTSAEWADSMLPANHHDWMYRLGRKFRLGPPWRLAADIAYRDECLFFVRRSLAWWHPFRPIAVARCWIRFAALRVGARYAWTAAAVRRRIRWGPEVK